MTAPLNTASLVSELREQTVRINGLPLNTNAADLCRAAADALESTSRALSEKDAEVERLQSVRDFEKRMRKTATRQRDEALAALKASEERGERLSQELASARIRPEPTIVATIARAIWDIRRVEEDRCDMELEDMPKDHSVWTEARAVAALTFGAASETRK